jgi:hypothetical protein
MSNRRKLRRYLADGITVNPYRAGRQAVMPRVSGPSPAPVWRESAQPLRVGGVQIPRAFLPGRRGQR